MQFPYSCKRCFALIGMSSVAAGLLTAPILAEPPLPQVERLKSSPVLQHLKPNPMPVPPRTPAEQTVAQMYLPEGFRAELVVAEPELHQPVAFAFDERGRIWVAEAHSYPTKRPPGGGLDQIVIFEDRDGDGKFESRKVFAKGLNLVSGLEIGYGGVWVGAAPELLFIPDRNHDDRPDGEPQVLLDGFGFQDTHECLNSFLWGPDGWLYGNQGVFNTAHIGKPGAPDNERVELRAGVWRYHPARHEFEVFASGGSNQWGLDYDERGQIFMTHCRSYWGRGGTTHVIQGGHFWNQANANYAPFIIADPPDDFPGFRNFLLASARHDHGAGGAGERGTDPVFGGHSHVGTMIYLGDNWPDEFRGHLFTHNLGGHQINHDLNQREGSGFKTVHAERDQFFCSDPKYVAVDLQYGPDGAVYTIDWYDQQHCHNPNTERWDRGNGRLYRIQYDATYQPTKVDLSALEDARLVEYHTHKNEWFVRTARRLLHERSLARAIQPEARQKLLAMVREEIGAAGRLRAMWTAHAIGALPDELAGVGLADPDEYVRGWAIQLCAEDGKVARPLMRQWLRRAREDASPVVRLFLASAAQRVGAGEAWELIEALSQHAEDRDDRNIPLLLWQSLAPRITENTLAVTGPGIAPRAGESQGPSEGPAKGPAASGAPRSKRPAYPNLERAFSLSIHTKIPQLEDFLYWYSATLGDEGLERVFRRFVRLEGEPLRRWLAAIALALDSQGRVPMPVSWKPVAAKLYSNYDPRVRRLAERVAGSLGDESVFPRLRDTLSSTNADAAERKHAFAVLSRAQDRASIPAFLRLLDDPAFRSPALNLLARFDAPEVPEALLRRFPEMSPPDRSAAVNALTSRAPFALAMLDAVAAGRLKREDLTSFHIRQLAALKNPEVDQRVAAAWGKLNQTPAEKEHQITRLEKVFNEAPLWAYDSGAGRQHFQKLCSQCHVLRGEGTRVGPELTGAGKNGIRYFLENIIDPNAVIGADFEMTTVETKKGEVISGLVVNETPGALTIRTTTDQVPIAKADLARRAKGELSLMAEGLLESLNDREQIELLKFLTSN